jgi:adenylate cyclase
LGQQATSTSHVSCVIAGQVKPFYDPFWGGDGIPLAREQRRLAAILAADVVGYSRLMGRDESGTVARLREHRQQRLEPTLARHGGRLVKLTGDGALVEFGSAVDALAAAIEFQQAMARANQDQPEDAAIVFRIGLHLGDLIVDGDDLYGDGVNVAARLEAEAPAGGIVISSNMHDAVTGRLQATFEDLGNLSLKNIERPVRTYRVRGEGSTAASSPVAVSLAADAPLTLPDKPSIAVLPFQNMSGDPEQEYFAEGMVEDIITALSHFSSLFVIARNSSFTYKGKAIDSRLVGRELGVRYLLQGSVRKAGDRLRVSGQLIDCERGTSLWADRFEGTLDNVFELQDQVASNVASMIAPKLDRAEIERTKRKPVDNLDAYDCYLRGLAKHNEMTKEACEEAQRFCYRAIELDPGYAAPYGLAASCHGLRKIQFWSTDLAAEAKETNRLALRAADVGGDDALALSRAGFCLAWVCGNLEYGAHLVDRALLINPNLATGWWNRGAISGFIGLHERSLEEVGRALRLSPIEPGVFQWHTAVSCSHFFLGNAEEAVKWSAKALAGRPNYIAALAANVVANVAAQNLGEAHNSLTRLLSIAPLLRIANLPAIVPFKGPSDYARFVGALRLAGLAE